MRYIFAPGRDVIVGHGGNCDIRLDAPDPRSELASQPIPDVVLRFAGTHWLAVDQSHRGLFLDGVRMSTIDIRDGQTIAIGDPQHGPRLRFQVTAPDDAPPPITDPLGVKKPAPRPAHASEPANTRIQAQPTPAEHSPLERPTRPLRYTPIDAPTAEQLPGRENSASSELPQTSRLPLLSGARTIGVTAHNLGLTVNGSHLLSNVTFTARPGSVIAVIGPSTARNVALTGLLAGTRPLTTGQLTVDGYDVHEEPDVLRLRIGAVSRDDLVHVNLTVERALAYAAELRLPPSAISDSRDRVVHQILDELELTPHRTARVAELTPAARRCVSLAVELLARPSLLVVEFSGAGLDSAQENHVMALMRRQADLGCVVVVTGTSLDQLNLCDQVLLLTPAGQLAFAGPPSHIDTALGTTDWLDIFARISADPRGAHHAFLMRQRASVSPTPPAVTRPQRLAPTPGFGRQLPILIRRQTRVSLARPVRALLWLLLPFVLGALTLTIPGDTGLSRPGRWSTNAHEAIEILAALNFGAVFMGTAVAIGSLVAERRILRREQAIGLSTSAYLLAKLVVFGSITAAQTAILTTIVIVGKGGPKHGAALLGTSPVAAGVELYVSVAATAVVSAIVGLALSTFGRSIAEAVLLSIPALLASLLFAGALVSLVGSLGYEQVSWFIPARWGFSAAAATVDLRRIDKLADHNPPWSHYSGWWVFDMVMLVVLGVLWAGFVRYRLRPPAGAPLHRETQK